MNIDIIECEAWEYIKNYSHNQVCKIIGKADRWNNELLREKTWKQIYNYLDEIHKLGTKSPYYANEFYGLFDFEVWLLCNGFQLEKMAHWHARNPNRSYKKGGAEIATGINGNQKTKDIWRVLSFYENDQYIKEIMGIPTIEEIKELV